VIRMPDNTVEHHTASGKAGSASLEIGLGRPQDGCRLQVRTILTTDEASSFVLHHGFRQEDTAYSGRVTRTGILGPNETATISLVGQFQGATLHVPEGDVTTEVSAAGSSAVAREGQISPAHGIPAAKSAGPLPAAPPPPASVTEPRRGEVVVYYGTSRSPLDPADLSKGYSGNRDRVVHYGTCKVFIPEAHKIGSIGSPWWKRLLSLTDDRLRLLSIDCIPEAPYWATMASQLRTVAPDDRDGVVFVHGYNVSLEESALRAAQLGFDLAIKGIMAFFSWPSKGGLADYPADEATIEASEGVIADYLTDFALKSGARMVHVIAHSMGNRGVLRAINRITAKASAGSPVNFGQVILAAADVDADTFRQLAVAYQQVAHRTTLYVSERDRAVEASGWLHQYARAGLMPPVLVLPGIDTINVTNSDLTMLGHGYVASARDVLSDMHNLITNDQPPERRFGVRPAQSDAGDRYWVIGA